MTTDLIGQTFKNNNGDEYTVLHIDGVSKSGNIRYRIQFLKTKYETTVEKVQMKRGNIKDRYSPSVYGIGFIGKYDMVSNKKEYNIWHGMISRCYNESDERYNAYGEIGVTVCYRWFSFENFLNDIRDIDGYDDELFLKGLLELDKDKKQLGKCNKVYSIDTCTFLSPEENQSMINDKLRHTFTAVSPIGEEHVAFGIKSFCKEHNLTHQRVILCLKGRAKTHKGWTFNY